MTVPKRGVESGAVGIEVAYAACEEKPVFWFKLIVMDVFDGIEVTDKDSMSLSFVLDFSQLQDDASESLNGSP